MLFGLFLAWASAGRLRYGYPFKTLFPQTCIYIPDEEVIPTLTVFLFGMSSAISCFVILLRRSEWLRKFAFGIIVAVIAFGFGVFINRAIITRAWSGLAITVPYS